MEGDFLQPPVWSGDRISIHSLRMEGDPRFAFRDNSREISIHSLRMEGDIIVPELSLAANISIHSLRMEGDLDLFQLSQDTVISIHSLRMEGDYVKSMRYVVLFTFQSTPSAWRETCLQW